MVKRVLFICCFLLPFAVFAQPKKKAHKANEYIPDTTLRKWTVGIYTQYNHLFYKQQYGLLQADLAYRIDGGNARSDTAQLHTTGFVPYPGHVFVLPGVEVGRGNFTVDVNMSPFTVPRYGWRWNYYAGFTYRIHYERWLSQAAELQPWFRMFPVSFILGLQWHHAVWEMGEVPLAVGETFSAYRSTYTNTGTTPGKVMLCFQQSTLNVTPSFSLGWRKPGGFWGVTIITGPFFPVKLNSGFVFAYRNQTFNGDQHIPNDKDLLPVNQPGMHATFNGQKPPDFPYKIQGWMLGVRIGLYAPAGSRVDVTPKK